MEPEAAFTELSTLVVGQVLLAHVLARVGELARACVPGAQEASVIVLEGGKVCSVAFTGSLAATLDERQYEAGFGPCTDAAMSRQTIRVDDTANEQTYPHFAAVAARQGVRSTLSVGVPLPQSLAGSINVYRFDAGALDDEAVRVLQDFAGCAAVVMANHGLYAAAVALNENLQAAMASRAVIEQAKGVLAARLRCTPEEAFAHLRSQSQHTNRKLREIAAEIVQRTAGG